MITTGAPTGRFALILLAASTQACSLPVTRLEQNTPFRTGTVRMAGAGVNVVEIRSGPGLIELSQSSDDSIRVTAELRSQDKERLERVCGPSSRLTRNTSGSTVVLDLEQSSRRQCGELWRVELPREVGATLRMRVGDVRVNAVLPRLEVDVDGPGSVKGSIDAPFVDIDLDIGDVEITSGQEGVGHARVESAIGSSSLTLRGLRIEPRRSGAGSATEARGDGSATIRVRTGNGRATLTLQ